MLLKKKELETYRGYCLTSNWMQDLMGQCSAKKSQCIICEKNGMN